MFTNAIMFSPLQSSAAFQFNRQRKRASFSDGNMSALTSGPSVLHAVFIELYRVAYTHKKLRSVELGSQGRSLLGPGAASPPQGGVIP